MFWQVRVGAGGVSTPCHPGSNCQVLVQCTYKLCMGKKLNCHASSMSVEVSWVLNKKSCFHAFQRLNGGFSKNSKTIRNFTSFFLFAKMKLQIWSSDTITLLCRACMHSFFIDVQSLRELRITSVSKDAAIHKRNMGRIKCNGPVNFFPGRRYFKQHMHFPA